MKGYLIVNHFLQGEKFDEINSFLLESAKKHNITLICRTNARLTADLPTDLEECREYFKNEEIDFALFWDKDIRLAYFLEKCGVRVFNPSHTIERCDDKSLTYLSLLGEGVPMPKTVIFPKTYFRLSELPDDLIDAIEESLGYPVVVKECYGSFGKQVYLSNCREELIGIIKECSPSPLIFQEFIASSRGRDLRLNVVGDRVLTAMERRNDGDFRANITNGGYMVPHTASEKEQELAIRVCRILGLDFAGVDLLFGEDGSPVLCEVNSNAHFINIFRLTGVNVADGIMSYILKEAAK